MAPTALAWPASTWEAGFGERAAALLGFTAAYPRPRRRPAAPARLGDPHHRLAPAHLSPPAVATHARATEPAIAPQPLCSPSVGAPEPDATTPEPLYGWRRSLAILWLASVVALYGAAQLGVPIVR